MTLIKFEPMKDFDRIADHFEKFFNTGNSAFVENKIVPEIDIYENNDSLVVEVETPGVKKEDMKITLEDNILTIEGEKKPLGKNDIEKCFRSERGFGKFKRSFTLPVDVDPDKVNANFENGVLSITLSKFDAKVENEKTIELK